MEVSLPTLPKLGVTGKIKRSKRILISGQRVTFEKFRGSWEATGWENGIPVARRPILESYLKELISRFPKEFVTYCGEDLNVN